MTEKEFSRTSHILYAGAVAIASMLYAVLVICVIMGVLQLVHGSALSATAQGSLIIPREYIIGFGWIFVILSLGEYFLYEDYVQELQKIREEIAEHIEFDGLLFPDDCILDGLDVLAGTIRHKKRDDPGGVILEKLQPIKRLHRLRWDIRQAASYRGVKIPAGDQYVLLFLGIPVLISCLLFTFQIRGAQQRQADLMSHTRTYIKQLAEEIGPICEKLEWETYEGHEVLKTDENMFLQAEFKAGFCPGKAAMHFQLDERCRLESLWFDVYIDPTASREEIIDQCNLGLSRLFPLYADGNFAEKDLYFEEMWTLPPDFCQEFLTTSYYPTVLYTAKDRHPKVAFTYKEDENGNLLKEESYISIFLFSF